LFALSTHLNRTISNILENIFVQLDSMSLKLSNDNTPSQGQNNDNTPSQGLICSNSEKEGEKSQTAFQWEKPVQSQQNNARAKAIMALFC